MAKVVVESKQKTQSVRTRLMEVVKRAISGENDCECSLFVIGDSFAFIDTHRNKTRKLILVRSMKLQCLSQTLGCMSVLLLCAN